MSKLLKMAAWAGKLYELIKSGPRDEPETGWFV